MFNTQIHTDNLSLIAWYRTCDEKAFAFRKLLDRELVRDAGNAARFLQELLWMWLSTFGKARTLISPFSILDSIRDQTLQANGATPEWHEWKCNRRSYVIWLSKISRSRYCARWQEIDSV